MVYPPLSMTTGAGTAEKVKGNERFGCAGLSLS
jgi:hypothetical protein